MRSLLLPNPHQSRLNLFDIGKILIAVILIIFVISRVRFQDILNLWGRISWSWFFAAALAYYANLVCLSYRYWLLVNQKAPFRDVLNATIFQTTIGNFIATSAGAVTYMGILRSKSQIPLSKGFSSLLIARLADFITLFIALWLSAWHLWNRIGPLQWIVSLILSCSAIGFLVLLLALLFHMPFLRFLLKVQAKFNLVRWQIWNKAVNYINSIDVADLTRQKAFLLTIAGSTLVYMLLAWLFSFCYMHAFSLPLDGWEVLFILSITQLMVVIPIQVFGGLGVNEVTNFYLFGLFNIAQSISAPAIISQRVLYYVLTLPNLLYSLSDVFLNSQKKPAKS